MTQQKTSRPGAEQEPAELAAVRQLRERCDDQFRAEFRAETPLAVHERNLDIAERQLDRATGHSLDTTGDPDPYRRLGTARGPVVGEPLTHAPSSSPARLPRLRRMMRIAPPLPAALKAGDRVLLRSDIEDPTLARLGRYPHAGPCTDDDIA